MRLTPRTLIDIIGDTDTAERLMDNWAGHQVPALPADYAARKARDQRILVRLEKETYAAVAESEGLSSRYVKRLAKQPA